MDDKPKLNMSQVVMTAVVTCVFTVIAGVVTYFLTSSSASLSYTLSSGPVITTSQTSKRIYSVVVENTGRKEVEATTLQFQIQGGRIAETSIESPVGVTPVELKTNDLYRATLPSLNPKEKLGVSMMVYVDNSLCTPVVSVRGKGVNGTEDAPAKTKSRDIVYLLVGMVSAILGVFLSVTPLMRRIIGRKTMPFTVSDMFFRSAGMVGPFERNEIVAFICGLCGLIAHARYLRFSPSEISFRGAADYLVSEALSTKSEDIRRRLRLALQSMLLVGMISDDSVEIIKLAVTKLGGLDREKCDETRKHAVNRELEPDRLRAVLIDYIESGGIVLPKQQGK